MTNGNGNQTGDAVQSEGRPDTEIRSEFEAIIREAHLLSADLGDQVASILEAGLASPLTFEEAQSLLKRVLVLVKEAAERRGDEETAAAIGGDISAVVSRVLRARSNLAQGPSNPGQGAGRREVQLQARNGIDPGPVRPTPIFHEREIPMNSGYVKTTDVELWGENDRLEIHIGQFKQRNGREPNAQELLDIMLSNLDLPGVSRGDQFAIVDLARSIALKGVRTPPIIDIDGTLLDGNRRIAASYYVLNSDEFSVEEKQRVEYTFVWQLTPHAVDEDREAVVVSNNFEPDYKEDWPDYVKARKVYETWMGMLAVEPRDPPQRRVTEMKKALSRTFALGPETAVVNRYLRMVDWANDFEEHHIGTRERDQYEVKHRADRYFQYFDELSKGTRPGGVAHALNQDEAFKHLAYDLLFDGKFKNWRQIRDLKHIYENQDAREILVKARNEPDIEEAQEHVDDAIDIAKVSRAEKRELGANSRIETFVTWLEELPVRAFRDQIKPDNLRGLLRALALVEKHAETVLREEGNA